MSYSAEMARYDQIQETVIDHYYVNGLNAVKTLKNDYERAESILQDKGDRMGVLLLRIGMRTICEGLVNKAEFIHGD